MIPRASHTKRILTGLLVAAAICGSLEAVPLRFLPVNQEIAAREIGVQDSTGKVTPLEDLNSQKRSRGYPCTVGDAPLLLVAMDRESPDGKPATAAIPMSDGLKSPLVLIFPDPDPERPAGLRALAIDDSGTGFPWGSLLFVNASDLALKVRCEEEEKPLPASLLPVAIAFDGDPRNFGVQVFKEEDPDSVLYSAVWEYDPRMRKLVFVVAADEPGHPAIELKVIPENRMGE